MWLLRGDGDGDVVVETAVDVCRFDEEMGQAISEMPQVENEGRYVPPAE